LELYKWEMAAETHKERRKAVKHNEIIFGETK